MVTTAGGGVWEEQYAVKGAADVLDDVAGKQTKSINALRNEVKQTFANVGKRIVIVLDDLDRLRADEDPGHDATRATRRRSSEQSLSPRLRPASR